MLVLAVAFSALNLAATSATPVGEELQALRSSDVQARRNAVLRLGAWRTTGAVDEVLAATEDEDRTVREIAFWALGRLGDPSAVPHLCAAITRALPREIEQFPIFALTSLKGLRDPRAVPTLRRVLAETHDVGFRESVVATLVVISPRDAAPTLLRLLAEDPDENIRAAAAQGLARVAGSSPLDPLVAAAGDEELEVRKAVAQSLVFYGAPARPALERLAGDEEPAVRRAALVSLERLQTVAMPAPEPLLAPEPTLAELRLEIDDLVAANAEDFQPVEQSPLYLGASWDPDQVREWLAHPQAEVRANAALLLGNMTGVPPAAREGLIAALKDPDSGVRWSAAKALGKLRHPASLEFLLEANEDPDKDVREDALEALGRLANAEDPRVERALLGGLGEPYPSVRLQAVRALSRLPGAEARSALARTARTDPNRSVRDLAWRLSWKVQPRYVN